MTEIRRRWSLTGKAYGLLRGEIKNKVRMEKELAIPFYLQVAETIRSRILGGYYIQGDLIPSYQELEKGARIRVGRVTMHLAPDAPTFKRIEILLPSNPS